MKIVKSAIDFVMDILETVVFIGSLFIVVYLFILTPNQVKGASMENTFHTGDYILTSRVTYKFRRFERGDVIVFKSPKNPDIEYIKRIIGLPGEVINISNGVVTVNNIQLAENYIAATTNYGMADVLKIIFPIRSLKIIFLSWEIIDLDHRTQENFVPSQ